MSIKHLSKICTKLLCANSTLSVATRTSASQLQQSSTPYLSEDLITIPKLKEAPKLEQNRPRSDWFNMLKKSRWSKKSIMKGQTKLGVIRLDYDYPPSPGDIDHHETFDCQVIYRVVPGFTFEMCKAGKLTADVHEEFIEAVEWLQDKNVSAITGDCGFMMYFQKLAREHSSTPVFMSSLSQLPAVTCAFQKNAQICIFTANLTSLHPMKDLILDTIGSDAHVDKFIMVGCENVPGFEAVDKGDMVDLDVVGPGVVELAKSTLLENPGIQAFLFECTQLPPFADAVREATGVPVYDAVTCCNFFTSGFQENKNFGKSNWKKPWLGNKNEYKFGQELPLEKKKKLVTKGEAEYFC